MHDSLFVLHFCTRLAPRRQDLGERPFGQGTNSSADRVTHRRIKDIPDRDAVTMKEDDAVSHAAVQDLDDSLIFQKATETTRCVLTIISSPCKRRVVNFDVEDLHARRLKWR